MPKYISKTCIPKLKERIALSYSPFCWKEVIAYWKKEGYEIYNKALEWALKRGQRDFLNDEVGTTQKYLIYGATEIPTKVVEVLKLMEQITRQRGTAMEDFVLSHLNYESFSSDYDVIDEYRMCTIEQKMLLLWLQKSTNDKVTRFLHRAECVHCSYKAYFYHVIGEETAKVKHTKLEDMLDEAEMFFCDEMDKFTGIRGAAIFAHFFPHNYELIFQGRYLVRRAIREQIIEEIEELFAKWIIDKGILRVEAPSYPIAQTFVKIITRFLSGEEDGLFKECSFNISEKAQEVSSSIDLVLFKIHSSQPIKEGRDHQMLTMNYASGSGFKQKEIPITVIDVTGKFLNRDNHRDNHNDTIFRVGGQDQPKNVIECSDRYVFDELLQSLFQEFSESKYILQATEIREKFKDDGIGAGSPLWKKLQPTKTPYIASIPISWYANMV